MYGVVFASTSAPWRTCCGEIPCVTSMIWTWGAIDLITPWQVPTKSSCNPKSLRKVMNTRADFKRSRRGRLRPDPPDRACGPPAVRSRRPLELPQSFPARSTPRESRARAPRTPGRQTPRRAQRGRLPAAGPAEPSAFGSGLWSRRPARRPAAVGRPRRPRRERGPPDAEAPRADPPALRPQGRGRPCHPTPRRLPSRSQPPAAVRLRPAGEARARRRCSSGGASRRARGRSARSRSARARSAGRGRRRSRAMRACRRAWPTAPPGASGQRSARGELEELPGQLGRIVAASPLEPRAVLCSNERGQLLAVVVRRDGCQAATADREDTYALGLDAAARLKVVDASNQLLLACTHLQRERALAGLRQELLRLKAVADLGVQAEPVEAAGRQDDRIEPTLATLAQAGVDVAAQRLDREARLARQQLGPAPNLC